MRKRKINKSKSQLKAIYQSQGVNIDDQILVNNLIAVFGKPPEKSEVKELLNYNNLQDKEIFTLMFEKLKEYSKNGNRKELADKLNEDKEFKSWLYSGWQKYGLTK